MTKVDVAEMRLHELIKKEGPEVLEEASGSLQCRLGYDLSEDIYNAARRRVRGRKR